MNVGRFWWLSTRLHQRGLTPLAKLVKTFNYLAFRAILPFQAEIERDLQLEHYALGVVSHPNVVIGRGCRIYHNVTLAAESPVGSEHKIIIGNDVTIGVGAIVIARSYTTLRIGDGAYVGAGAVVTGDVASGEKVGGIPAKPLRKS